MNETISVILVNYNGKQYNDKCIESVLASTIKEQLKVIVVDNASTDDSLMLLQKRWGEHEQVHIIALRENYGFAKANNVAIEWAREQKIPYFLLLNNDTEIEPDAIEKLFLSSRDKDVIAVPKILFSDNRDRIWCAGGAFTACIKKPVQLGLNEKDEEQYEVSRYCDFANGCCLFFSEEVVQKLGLLDEAFFLYHEDTEYSLRAKEKGIRVWYCHEAIIYHKVNGSTGGNEKPDNAYYIARNWLRCSRMHLGAGFYLFCLYFFFNRLAWAVIWLAQGRGDFITATLEGIKDYLQGNGGKYRSREEKRSE